MASKSQPRGAAGFRNFIEEQGRQREKKGLAARGREGLRSRVLEREWLRARLAWRRGKEGSGGRCGAAVLAVKRGGESDRRRARSPRARPYGGKG